MGREGGLGEAGEGPGGSVAVATLFLEVSLERGGDECETD